MGIAMMGVMHIYFNSTQLLFKAFIGIKNLYDARPVSIHVLGQPAVGDLKRPFETVSMFGLESIPFLACDAIPHGVLDASPSPRYLRSAAASPQTDATVTAEAEGEKRVGKKED